MKEPNLPTLPPCYDHRDAVTWWHCLSGQSIALAPLHLHGWALQSCASLGVIWLFWLFYILDVLWMHNALCHIRPLHVSTPVYISSWNNSRVMSACFAFWGNKGVELVPESSCQHPSPWPGEPRAGVVLCSHL